MGVEGGSAKTKLERLFVAIDALGAYVGVATALRHIVVRTDQASAILQALDRVVS